MALYVDPLMARGWRVGSRVVPNCHLFTDAADLAQLHALAQAIGMDPAWFQESWRAPHYDLTPTRRLAAIRLGALPVSFRTAAGIWKARRALLVSQFAALGTNPVGEMRMALAANAVLPLTAGQGVRA